MRVGVTGSGGLLGRTLVPLWRQAGADVIAWTRADLDVTDAEAVRRAVADARPACVVHLAAYTDVDGAEAAADEAMRVNAGGTAHVAAACRAVGATCVYVSSDYVLQGERAEPLPPDSPLRPRGAYAVSKAAGELAVQAAGGVWLVARTGWVFGPGGPNFVDTMLAAARAARHVRVVDDQHGAPASTALIAEVLWRLVRAGCRGTWHVVPSGAATWFEVARTVYAAAGVSPELVTPCSSADAGRPAPRPRYSILDTRATAAAIGAPLPPWQRDVETYVRTGTLPSGALQEV